MKRRFVSQTWALLTVVAVAAWFAAPVLGVDGKAECQLLDVEGGELDVSEKTCQECSMACATNSNCHTLVFDGREFKKAATSSCEPIPFWEEFYSIESTQNWITAAQSDPEAYFSTWMDAYSKKYADDEAEDRRKVWESNLEAIYEANEALGAGLAPNELADQSMDETALVRGGLPEKAPRSLEASDAPSDSADDSSSDSEEEEEEEEGDLGSMLNRGSRKLLETWSGTAHFSKRVGLPGSTPMRQGARLLAEAASVNATSGPPPASFDWREKGMPIKVRNQGECNSCYAFAASTHMESLWWLATGAAVDLSENDIQRCCDLPSCWVGNIGICANPLHCGPCNNGWPHIAMSWVVANGQATEQVSAYDPDAFIPWDRVLPSDYSECKLRSEVVQLDQHVHFDQQLDVSTTPITEEQLKALVVQRPIVIAMDMLDDNFRFLGPAHTVAVPALPRGGINHAVVLLGYGEHEKGGPYWLIQNSWGTQWGDAGLARLARTADDPWKVLQYTAAAYLKTVVTLPALPDDTPAPQPSAPAPSPSSSPRPAAAATPAPGPDNAPVPGPGPDNAPVSGPGPNPSLEDVLDIFAPTPGPSDNELWMPSPKRASPSPSPRRFSPSPRPASPRTPSPGAPSPQIPSPGAPSPARDPVPSPEAMPDSPSPRRGSNGGVGGDLSGDTEPEVDLDGVGGVVAGSSPGGGSGGVASPAGQAASPAILQPPAASPAISQPPAAAPLADPLAPAPGPAAPSPAPGPA